MTRPPVTYPVSLADLTLNLCAMKYRWLDLTLAVSRALRNSARIKDAGGPRLDRARTGAKNGQLQGFARATRLLRKRATNSDHYGGAGNTTGTGQQQAAKNTMDCGEDLRRLPEDYGIRSRRGRGAQLKVKGCD